MPDSIERLSRLFEHFPGIGPRQAGRFVQYILRASPSMRRELASAIEELARGVHQCPECFRFHAGGKKLCSICGSLERDRSELAVVASDADLGALEHSGTYRGLYFVLGGTMSLASDKQNGLRQSQLIRSLDKRIANGLKEVILAFPANPEGDATADFLRAELAKQPNLRITTLGRGLSTGSELEYADPETLRSAFDSRR